MSEAKREQTKAKYEQNTADAIAVEAIGSPSYVLNGEVFWGQDRLDLLDDALRTGRLPPFGVTHNEKGDHWRWADREPLA